MLANIKAIIEIVALIGLALCCLATFMYIFCAFIDQRRDERAFRNMIMEFEKDHKQMMYSCTKEDNSNV